MNNANASNARRFTVDTTSPNTINLTNITDGGNYSFNTLVFGWFPIDNTASSLRCNLSLDGVVNVSNVDSVNGSATYSVVSNLSDKAGYQWVVACNDTVNNANSSNAGRFSVDVSPPKDITLNYPSLGLNTSSTSLDLNFTVIDVVASYMVCNLTLDGTLNKTNLQAINGTLVNATVSGLAQGTHQWNVTCVDGTVRNQNISMTSYFSVDTAGPAVALIAPANNSWYSTATAFLFNYTPTDGTLAACDLWLINETGVWAINQSDPSATSGVNNNFTLVNITTEGRHYWNVKCNDTQGTGAFNTTNYTFAIDLTDPTPSVTLSASSVEAGQSVTITCGGSDNLDDSTTNSLTSVALPNSGSSSDLDGTFTDTTLLGTYTVTCTSTDDAARSATGTNTFTVTGSSTGTGSGGSGGGGEPTPSQSQIFSVLTPGTEIAMQVTDKAIGLNEISILVRQNVENARVTVSKLNSKPGYASEAPPGTVNRYIEIDAPALKDKVEKATIKFNVENSWFEENSAVPADVRLLRYNQKWEELETKFLGKGPDNTAFEAVTPGFSLFAVTAKAVEQAPVSEEVAAEPVEEAALPVVEEPVVQEEAAPVVEEKKSSPVLGIAFALVLIVLAVLVVVYLKLRSKEQVVKKK